MLSAQFKTSRIEVRNNNRVYIIPEADDIYNAQDFIELLTIINNLVEEERYTILMKLDEIQVILTKDARNLFNSDFELKKRIIAEAVVIKSTSSMILYNLILMVSPPSFPFKAFKDEGKANDWLDRQN